MINIYIIRVSEDARPDRYFKLSLKNKVSCKIYYLEFKNRIILINSKESEVINKRHNSECILTDTFGQRGAKSNKNNRQSARDQLSQT